MVTPAAETTSTPSAHRATTEASATSGVIGCPGLPGCQRCYRRRSPRRPHRHAARHGAPGPGRGGSRAGERRGRLGGKELGYGSDLDVVFLFDETQDAPDPQAGPDTPSAIDAYLLFARKLVTWLTLRTSAGELFDIDTALRPNGNSGLLVTSFHAFDDYQRQRGSNTAWTWEHQALSRARWCAGEVALAERFETTRRSVLSAVEVTNVPHSVPGSGASCPIESICVVPARSISSRSAGVSGRSRQVRSHRNACDQLEEAMTATRQGDSRRYSGNWRPSLASTFWK